MRKLILPVTATALVFGQTSCKDELTLTERLVGEWNIDEAYGDIKDFLDESYEIHLEFHMDGDFEFSMIDNDYKYTYLGDWEWANTNMDEVEMSVNDMDINLKIDTFEGDVITGEMEFSYDGDSYDGNVALERVYIDNNDLIKKTVPVDSEAINSKPNNKLRDFMKRNSSNK